MKPSSPKSPKFLAKMVEVGEAIVDRVLQALVGHMEVRNLRQDTEHPSMAVAALS